MSRCRICGNEFVPYRPQNTVCSTPSCKLVATRQRGAKWYYKDVEAARAGARERKKRNGYTAWPAKRALGLEIATLKASTPCADCGIKYPEECMDFDHLSDDKINNVGTMVAHGHSRDKVMAEIAKCELVCANCHRTRTKKRRLNV